MVGFPGIGLQFKMDPILFRISNSFAIHWYGLIIAAGFLLAVMYCLRVSKKYGVTQDEVIDMLLVAAPAGIIFARLYYVAFNWAEFRDDPAGILRIWDGGMAVYGSIIGSVIACVLFCYVRRISIGAMLDIGAQGLIIGQAVGRWGNFVNIEVYGRETTLPWRMWFSGLPEGAGVHPLFLYESLWNAAGFVLLWLLARKRKYNGQIFLVYTAWYGLGRGLLEGLRDQQYNLMLGKLMISQIVALVTCFAALALLLWHAVFKKHEPEELLAWTAERDSHVEYVRERRAGKCEKLADGDEDWDENEDDDIDEDIDVDDDEDEDVDEGEDADEDGDGDEFFESGETEE